tara:strand:- start:22 stop:966 length:945 start_codon:yes stop_codon:yes gene_type:complete
MKLKKPKFWDYPKPSFLALLLLPFSFLFKLINFYKRKNKIKKNKIFTICIGNIYLGGTGKTSLALTIKKILEGEGKKVCFIKKNHKDQTDEQKLLSQNGKTFIREKRLLALEDAISENFEIAIFDDGLQDYTIAYDLNLVCFNKMNWIGNGLMIPAGPLREDLKSIRTYENFFLNGNNENLDNIKNKIKKISPDCNIFESEYFPTNLNEFDKDEKYIAFSGIGNHKTFIDMLKIYNFNVLKDIEFPDHYNYTNQDIDKIVLYAEKENAKIITTEKDFLRINKDKNNKIKFVIVELKIKNLDQFKKIILNKNENN